MFIFLDESGNFTGDKEPYFIIGGFITNNPKRTTKAFRKWQHTKFPKKIRRKNEVKFSDTGLNEKLRLKTIEYFSKQDIRIFYTFLKKSNIPLEYRKKKGLESGLLYTEIIAQTLDLLLPTTDSEFRVFRDQRHLKRVSQTKFNKLLKPALLPNLPAKAILQIKAIDSSTDTNIQIADWICGALFRYYNEGKNGKEFFLLLKNNIIESGHCELFKDYWTNKKSR
ncbi:DUF3800 domain-containing protein [Patescibacteria group bacterium]|nr:DUF3800 domain-containing protein [Patescibacteria group bacterium]MBU1563560.1 DUF3800 domain-containing protein [Patescibacteria group bacterium]MBU2068104.1 DUF3800 domain-containing protein [Patescibacteria group bacterium]